MNLRHLRTFAAIVDAGGVARAAALLNMTQPTASRQIDALEEEFGVPLFDRVGRRLLLTSEGEDLLRRSRRLLADAESLGERARALKSGQTGVLRVGATPQFIESLMVDFVAQYQQRHSGVEVRLIEDAGGRLPDRLERGDLHLTISSGAPDRFHWRLLCPIHVLAVLRKDHALGRRRALEVSELLDQPILLLNESLWYREWFLNACRSAGRRPRVAFESVAAQTLVALAAGGHGIAVLPAGVLVMLDKVRAIPVLHRGTPLGRWRIIAWHPQRFRAPYAVQFVEELVRYCRRNYPNRDVTRRAPPLPRPREPAGQSVRINSAR